MSGARYIPAVSVDLFPTKKELDAGDMSARARYFWWSNESLFRYKYMLASAYYGLKHDNFRERIGVGRMNDPEPKNRYCMWADSGGYQTISQGVDIDALEVLRWQEVNADKGFTLDVPLFNAIRDDDGFFLDFNRFKEGAQKTWENNKIFVENRNPNSPLQLYNVIHGTTVERLTYWYDMMKDFPFEAWSTGLKPASNVMLQAFGMMFLYSKGIRGPIHLLGVSGFDVIPMIVYASQWIQNLTFDSASYAQGAISRLYQNPINPKRHIPLGERAVDRMLEKLPCNCVVCQYIMKEGLLPVLYDKGTQGGRLINLHNLWYFIQYTNQWNCLLKDMDAFINTVKFCCNDETLRAIEYINYCMLNSWEEANEKFGPYFGRTNIYQTYKDEPDYFKQESDLFGGSLAEV